MTALATRARKVCDRCGFGTESPATTERKFTLGADAWVLELCERHAGQFDREVGGWCLLAREDDYPTRIRGASVSFTAEVREAEAHAARLRQAEQDAERERLGREQDAAALERRRLVAPVPTEHWTLSQHATQRAGRRGFTQLQVLNAAADPEYTNPAPDRYGPQVRVHVREGCATLVNTADRQVITVYPSPSSPDYVEDHGYDSNPRHTAPPPQPQPERIAR